MTQPWRQYIEVAELNRLATETLSAALGIEILDVGPAALRGRMPVDGRTRQPFGLLHGGASVALAETLGSIAGMLCVEDPRQQAVVGVEINANHLRAVRSGWVFGEARPLKLGQRFQVWQIDIRNEANDLVCVARFTAAVVPRVEPGSA